MRVLVAHVRYRERGGEDQVFDDEVALLRSGGLEVSTLDVPAVNLQHLGSAAFAQIAMSGGNHSYGRVLLRTAVAKHRPDVVHFHNIYPLLGVGAMREARDAGCGVVRTYHNYRLSCIAGTHFHSGAICERCSPGRRAPGVLRGCYRGSRLQSLAMAAACEGEWHSLTQGGPPDVALCQTNFAREKLVGYRMPAGRIRVKPNSVEASLGNSSEERSGAVFLGRLSPEKGVIQLVDAWGGDAPPLTVLGGGVLLPALAARRSSNLRVVGAVPHSEARLEISRARVVVVPSLAYESDSLVIAEALAGGTPVVCFDHGALSRIGEDISTECLVPTGDFRALVRTAARIVGLPTSEWSTLSWRARVAFERNHTKARSLAMLLKIYGEVIASRPERLGGCSS
jgi:glycosyltransferase involved in cell wall biosynthesis